MPLLDHLGVGVQPGQRLAVARRQGQPVQLASGAQPFGRGQEQALDPLPGQRRDRHDFLLARRFRLDALALLGREQIHLVPRLDQGRATLARFDDALGLNLTMLSRGDLRLRPASATLDEKAIETRLDARKDARAAKDFARSDAIRDELIAAGVEVMDGDPLRWEWRVTL